MAGTWSLHFSSIGVLTRLKNTVVLKTWRGNSQEVNTIRILLAPRLSGGEYIQHLICIRGRTSNAEPPYTAIMAILPITHAGVFLYFDILVFLNRCILQVCIFVFLHFISEPLHSAIMSILYCTLPSWALSPLFRDAFIHHRLQFFTAYLSLMQYWKND